MRGSPDRAPDVGLGVARNVGSGGAAVHERVPRNAPPVFNLGAREFTKLRRAGAYNLSQDQMSCVVYGMPKSLVDAGGADEVLPLERIGDRIRALLGC